MLHGNPKRALLAFQAMQKAYYIKGTGLYAGEPYSYLWPFSQALAATVSMANVPTWAVSFARELHARVIGLGSYWTPTTPVPPKAPSRTRCPGSTAPWRPRPGRAGPSTTTTTTGSGSSLLRMYKLTRSASLLGSAEAIMAFETAAWQASPELGCPGGHPVLQRRRTTPNATP